jgi:hypothetical protein
VGSIITPCFIHNLDLYTRDRRFVATELTMSIGGVDHIALLCSQSRFIYKRPKICSHRANHEYRWGRSYPVALFTISIYIQGTVFAQRLVATVLTMSIGGVDHIPMLYSQSLSILDSVQSHSLSGSLDISMSLFLTQTALTKQFN